MLILLSPAKTLDFDKPVPVHTPTVPRFDDQARTLAAAAAKLSGRKLTALMGISDKLATLNRDRFRGFGEADERAAAFAFAGDVYRGLRSRALDDDELAFAQDHLRILSGLYGLLRPLDAIRPYRLEMGTRWAPGRSRDLYAWWGDRVSALLGTDLAVEGSGEVLNLASQEYAHVVTQAPPAGARIVAVDFRELGPKGLRFNTFTAKTARGTLARRVIETRTTRLDAVRALEADGYRHDADGSTEDSWRWLKRLPA